MDTSTTKGGFTLVELLVVVGIMASMATLSIGGYFAVSRGMADRGALAAATSVIVLAQERACIDLTPTVVYFYNEVVQREDEDAGVDRVVAGVAVAVRRAGRVTRVAANSIGDEFADLNRTYDLVETSSMAKGDTFLLYKFNFTKMETSSVYSSVVDMPVGSVRFLVEAPDPNVSRQFKRESNRNDNEEADEIASYAFRVKSGDASWKVGDAYGYEFARIRLPDNYIFGSGNGDAPKGGSSASDRIKKLDGLTIKCMPDKASSQTALTGGMTVPIICIKPDGSWRKVGDSLKEMNDA